MRTNISPEVVYAPFGEQVSLAWTPAEGVVCLATLCPPTNKIYGRQERKWDIMFNFRIIACAGGADVIDTRMKTPYSSLTHVQVEDYIEIKYKNRYSVIFRSKSWLAYL